jgi:hypothetical protein
VPGGVCANAEAVDSRNIAPRRKAEQPNSLLINRRRWGVVSVGIKVFGTVVAARQAFDIDSS